MTPCRAWDEERASSLMQPVQHLPGALLPVLHTLQREFGYIDDLAIPLIARNLNLSEAEVDGVVSFYHDFRRTPPGQHVLRVCRAESCQSMGCEKLVKHIERRTGMELGSTTEDGSLTTEAVYCLGNCALSPSVMLDDQIYGRVTAATIDALLDDVRRQS